MTEMFKKLHRKYIGYSDMDNVKYAMNQMRESEHLRLFCIVKTRAYAISCFRVMRSNIC